MKGFGCGIAVGLGVLLLVTVIIGGIVFAPNIRGAINTWRFGIQKADDATRYDTAKKVEDTARAMIASYKQDSNTYKTYKDAANPEHQGWAQSARIRANQTASTYNEYVLKNSFIWKGNVPADIYLTLETL